MKKSTFGWLAFFSFGCALFALGAGLVLFARTSSTPKSTRVPADFLSLRSALHAYVINAGEPPTSRQGLAALVTRPTTAPLPRDWVQVIETKPLDPWLREYRYERFAKGAGPFRIELRSAGPDGVFGNTDDIFEVMQIGR